MTRPIIRRLASHVVDLIAAGEVVERPAAALKELVENALDAGATRLEIVLRGGGCESIEVTDNGCGMTPEELSLAVERHCTSKLEDDQLVRIRTLGFRGEALPSIGASARLSITSRVEGSASAWRLKVEGGDYMAPSPTAGAVGTQVVVRDLFFATPARRKFLKTARVEGARAEAVVRRLALSAPHCAFFFQMDGREVLTLSSQNLKDRVAAVLEVPAGALLSLDETRGPMRLTGFLCGPGHTRVTGAGQYILVNNRPVMDPVLRTAVRVAYRPVIERGRFPILFLHLFLPLERVDVNVHPAKTELRFADESEVKALVIGAVGRALARGAGEGGGLHARLSVPFSPSVSSAMIAEEPLCKAESDNCLSSSGQSGLGFVPSVRQFAGFAENARTYQTPPCLSDMVQSDQTWLEKTPSIPEQSGRKERMHPLGVPIGQIHATYILAIAPDGDLILVDQHAAHERLTHEHLHERLGSGTLAAQTLLMPAVVDLRPSEAEALLACRTELAQLGMELESFGAGSVLVRSMPALLNGADCEKLVHDIAEELAQDPDLSARQTDSLDRRLEGLMARMACHGSIRAGRVLKHEEMDVLLRDMEQHPRANTCPHGRPTWLRLSRAELEKLFGRVK